MLTRRLLSLTPVGEAAFNRSKAQCDMRVRKVAVLGASGIVSQRFQQRLAIHPWFELVAVFGSQRTAGTHLSELTWHLPEARPQIDLTVSAMSDLHATLEARGVEVVFSALPSDVAHQVEKPLVAAGWYVFSNASAHRMDADVPLVVADLNPHHLLPLRMRPGPFLACATNCTVIPAALPLKPLWDFIGLSKVSIRTEQALSGGGKSLMEAAHLAETCETSIPGEAEKMQEELLSLLGRATPMETQPAAIESEVACARVMRDWGHRVFVEAHLSEATPADEVIEWLGNYRSRPQTLDLPSAPASPFIIRDSLDIEADLLAGADPASDLRAGMAITVAEIRCEGDRVHFTALSENTIRGAAGGTVLLAELCIAEGLLGD